MADMRELTPAVFSELPPPSYAADVTRTLPVGRDRRERGLLFVLEERLTWLSDQTRRGDTSGGANRRRHEIAALRWALSRIADLERIEAELAPPPRRELAFATRKKEALALADELGGEAVRDPSRRGYAILAR